MRMRKSLQIGRRFDGRFRGRDDVLAQGRDGKSDDARAFHAGEDPFPQRRVGSERFLLPRVRRQPRYRIDGERRKLRRPCKRRPDG